MAASLRGSEMGGEAHYRSAQTPAAAYPVSFFALLPSMDTQDLDL
jgi:hypothetical protein